MKMLSLWEPYASLMALGHKRIETRSWTTTYRGPLAIHAAAGGLSRTELIKMMGTPEIVKLGLNPSELNPGHILAVVDLVDCRSTRFPIPPGMDIPRERAFGNYEPGRWMWITQGLKKLRRPIPFKAHQGLCEVPADVVERIIAEA